MGERRRYTDVQRAEALAALAANGGDLTATASRTGIPRRTIENWSKGNVHPDVTKLGEEKKADLADRLEAIAWKLAEAIPDKIDAAPLNQTAVALGIAIDKARLLRGQPTNINDNTHRIAELTDAEIDQRIRELEERLPGGVVAG